MTNDIEIISRKEAKERGLKRYFTGKPCKHGHIAERGVLSGCLECHRIKLKSQDRSKYKYPLAKKAEYQRNKERYINYKKQNQAPLFIRRSLERISSNWKGGRKKMEKLHGYTFEQLATRIEFQFKDGMGWDNRSEWHIDHKKPIARFLEQGITDPKIVNALSNLQPMWASENRSKGAKFEL